MENKINIGELDTLVTIQSVTQTRGSQAEVIETFTDIAKVYAKVDRRVSESVNDDNLESGRRIALTIYKIHNLSTRWRVIIGGVPYEILSIDDISRISPLCTLTLGSIAG